MPTFRKFVFPDQATADKLLAYLQPLDFPVAVWNIEKGVGVDILFNEDCPKHFEPYLVWPTPCGVHSFSGWEEQYAEDHKEFATFSDK
jgi:hypothetical protein